MGISTILIIALAVIIIWSIKTYNKLQSGKQSIIEQASNMQVSLQKRRDLASRVLDIAQGFGDHEKLTHLKISSNQDASTESLAALSQSFPELKANETYIQLMKQLEELENNISDKRESYNGIVKVYNSYRSSFPTMLVANKLSFEPAPYYDAANEDSLSQLATFTRDDAAAVKNLINASSKSIKKSANSLKDTASNKIEGAINSEIVKSAVAQGDIAMGKAVEVVKSKAGEINSPTENRNEKTKVSEDK
ncbi:MULTISPECIES: LemA family protein [unclassified Photobacterium]|uniref:LemA family protein n=1 Tax=unclassified Photobacterium TaxID=2628852 RepID=UPI000D16BC49|nr:MULTISPECIES: LemA family protein [unclassified Photobacterium]PSV26913.1 LemA family protein [Photobacterium sp. GB-56]PSV30352.1 LemA family protein [Photobacterium sp. GB-27]PSV33931.1 LemA family protein [Photobacterium sp. GB-210]PSV41281.1 LemA family protein [Photobacterium sp. GB-36]PSV54141.1 LemA family protein [Photobacterium sp. GB-1]